jgi:hypothetical protein
VQVINPRIQRMDEFMHAFLAAADGVHLETGLCVHGNDIGDKAGVRLIDNSDCDIDSINDAAAR